MNDLKKALQELNQNVPDMLKKMLDDLMEALPSLKPLIMGLCIFKCLHCILFI